MVLPAPPRMFPLDVDNHRLLDVRYFAFSRNKLEFLLPVLKKLIITAQAPLLVQQDPNVNVPRTRRELAGRLTLIESHGRTFLTLDREPDLDEVKKQFLRSVGTYIHQVLSQCEPLIVVQGQERCCPIEVIHYDPPLGVMYHQYGPLNTLERALEVLSSIYPPD